MLQSPPSSSIGGDYSQSPNFEHAPPNLIDIQRVLAAVRRQYLVLAVAIGAALLAGGLYLLNAEPLYTADAFVLIDNRRIRAVETSYDLSNSSADLAASIIDSQVEVVRAEKIAARVVRGLGLLNDPAFKDSLFHHESRFLELRRRFLKLLGRPAAEQEVPAPSKPSGADEQTLLNLAARAIQKNMDVRRVARTMVLQFSYTSPNPEKSARFANAFAEAYLADQLDAKYEATRLASQWLEERIGELKTKALNSDLAIQRFREEHGLIVSAGRLVNEQQLSEINTQLVTARADTARALARHQRIDAIIKGRQTEAIISEAIGNTVIDQLRSKYLEASKRYAEVVAKLGPGHQASVSFRAEMTEYEKLMFSELTRLAQGYSSELEIARAREKALEIDLQRVMALNAGENKDLVALHELEREGEAYRNLYQTYLQRYNEALQQQSFPIIEARIITSASAPSGPSHPKKLPMLLLFGLAGAALGAAIGFLREWREKGFHSVEQVRQLGLEFLGILPRVTKMGSAKTDAGPNRDEPANDGAGDASRANPNFISVVGGVYSYSLLLPRSGFAETLRATKLAADVRAVGSQSKIIGVISALPGEGKSVFSKNFASLLAQLDQKTLLIDGDLRVAGLTKKLAPTAKKGLVEAVVYGEPLEDLLMTEESSGLSFLPCVMPPRMSHSSELLTSNNMKELLSEIEAQFDYIVLDLPPLVPVVDARAIAPLIQSFVFIAEWRKTGRQIVRNIFAHNNEIYNKCLGIVFSKVNVNELRLFGEAGSHLHHYTEFANSYYFENSKN
jgi:polysaccharide biosynthesis transport protein